MAAAFEAAAWSRIDLPPIMNQFAMPGVCLRISLTWSTTARVRDLRRGVGELHADDRVTLILRGMNPVGSRLNHQPVTGDEAGEEEHHRHDVPDRAADDRGVGRLATVVDRVEGAVEEVLPRGRRPQIDCALRRLERHGVDRADERGRGDRQGKLPVELAGDPAEERGRQEHGHEDQRDTDDRPDHLGHGLDRRLFWVHLAAVDMMDGVFDDHDGVVDDDADRQDQPEKSEHVDREAEGGHGRESADDGHGHGRRGNQHGPPILQEDQDHDQDEHAGFKQRLVDFVDRLIDEIGRD